MPDTFVETTRTSWLSRIAQSLLGVIFGILFVFGSIVLLFWNEGRAVQTARSLAEGGKVVIDAAPEVVDSANDGKLIHVSGNAAATAPLRDPDFDIATVALRLVRVAEMYQWQENKREETRKNLGGSEETVTTYTYNKVWSKDEIRSGDFRHPEDHNNPPKRYGGMGEMAKDATLGAFRLDIAVLTLLPANAPVRVDAKAADKVKTHAANAQVVGGQIYIGADPDHPAIGDYRISFATAPNGPISVIGRQAGSAFAFYQTKAGDRLLMAVPGTQSAADMFKEAEEENRILTWVIRVAGIFAAWLGVFLVLRPLVVVADVVPVIGNILGAGAGLVALVFAIAVGSAVIAIAWLWYRPLVSLAVLAVGAVAGIGLHRLAARRGAARTPAPAPAA